MKQENKDNTEKYTKRKPGRPAKPNFHSTTLRIQKDLWKAFKVHCIKNEVSITDELNLVLLDFMANHKKKD